MNTVARKLADLMRLDCDAAQIGPEPRVGGNVLIPESRLAKATQMLLTGERRGLEAYLFHLFNTTARQIGADIALGPTFREAVKDLSLNIIEALPERTLAALRKLATLSPIRLPDAHMLAHAIVADSKLVAWLLEDETCKTRKPKATDATAAYRRLASKLHPDRQHGDNESMRDLNTLRDAALRR